MTEQQVSWLDRPFYILLLSAYPSLALLSTNSQEVNSVVVVRPLLASILFSGAVIAILLALFRNHTKAFLGTVVVLLVFFSFGHITRSVLERFTIEHERVVDATIWIALFLLLCLTLFGIAKAGRDFSRWSAGLNIAALALLLFPLFKIASTTLRQPPTLKNLLEQPKMSQHPPMLEPEEPLVGSGPVEPPDIYYIILDGYSRADTLEAMGYDNSEFLNSLEELGFYVVQCSKSNYRSTLLSMPSIFNMEYLHDFLPYTGEDNSSVPLLSSFLIHSRVRAELEKLGYTIVSFETGYQWNEWEGADFYLSASKNLVLSTLSAPYLTQFEYIFLQNTALAPFVENSEFGITRYNDLYNRVNFTLEELPNTTTIPGPKFVYAHILSPHYPFIFLPDGSLNKDYRYYTSEEGTPDDPELTRLGYINNVQYLNSRVPGILRAIIQNSATPPVIIVQGDHGHIIPERRFNNLNAFYLPHDRYELLYPQMSSVNTFRVVFNEYFGANLPLLDDVSLDAHIGDPLLNKPVKPFPESCT